MTWKKDGEPVESILEACRLLFPSNYRTTARLELHSRHSNFITWNHSGREYEAGPHSEWPVSKEIVDQLIAQGFVQGVEEWKLVPSRRTFQLTEAGLKHIPPPEEKEP